MADTIVTVALILNTLLEAGAGIIFIVTPPVQHPFVTSLTQLPSTGQYTAKLFASGALALAVLSLFLLVEKGPRPLSALLALATYHLGATAATFIFGGLQISDSSAEIIGYGPGIIHAVLFLLFFIGILSSSSTKEKSI